MVNWKCLFNILILISSVQSYVNESDVVFTHDKGEVLSRKKRFLIFPEGSSFQIGKTETNFIFYT